MDKAKVRLLNIIQYKVEEKKVLLLFDNNVQIQHFNEFKKEMMQELFQKLDNNLFQLELLIETNIEENTTKKYYTQSDKLEMFLKKNATLRDLITKFGLDLDL